MREVAYIRQNWKQISLELSSRSNLLTTFLD